MDAVFHAMDTLERAGDALQAIALLQPTSPLCTAEDVKNAVDLYLDNECDSVVSMHEPSAPPYWMFKKGKEYIEPLFGWDYLTARSQDLPQTLMPNGAVYIASVATIKKFKKFYTKKTIPYIMPIRRSIDIDNESDFIVAEAILKGEQ